MSHNDSSRFFAVSVTGGQEEHLARIVEVRAKASKEPLKIKAIFIPPSLKGIIIVEANSYGDVVTGFENLKYVKKIIPGMIPMQDIENLLEVEKKEEVIEIGDLVEITLGPFKGMIAKVINVRGEKDRREAVIQLQDASASPIPIIIPVSNLRKKK